MMEPEWSKKCYTILINEIVPRAKKLNMPIEEFMTSSASGHLAMLEYQGHITRRELRTILDERVKFLNDSLQENQV